MVGPGAAPEAGIQGIQGTGLLEAQAVVQAESALLGAQEQAEQVPEQTLA
jgi:hypothetical protein